MEYEHSLTYAVQMQVDGYIQTQGAQAGARLNRCGSARELLPLLIDPETISTPGFVLRRTSRPREWCAGWTVPISAALEMSHGPRQ